MLLTGDLDEDGMIAFSLSTCASCREIGHIVSDLIKDGEQWRA